MNCVPGMQVVPHRKTIWGPLSESVVWEVARARHQPYLYIIHFDTQTESWVLDHDKDSDTGDFFNESDFTIYDVPQRMYGKFIKGVDKDEVW